MSIECEASAGQWPGQGHTRPPVEGDAHRARGCRRGLDLDVDLAGWCCGACGRRVEAHAAAAARLQGNLDIPGATLAKQRKRDLANVLARLCAVRGGETADEGEGDEPDVWKVAHVPHSQYWLPLKLKQWPFGAEGRGRTTSCRGRSTSSRGRGSAANTRGRAGRG